MQINLRTLAYAAIAISITGIAHATPIVRGEWKTTARIVTPQGSRSIHENACNQGQGIAKLLRQQGEQCTPWKKIRSDSGGTDVLRSTCTDSGPFPGGTMTLHAQARVTVAPDGRSAHGTVRATGHVNGMSFSSPPTHFTSRFVGACTRQ